MIRQHRWASHAARLSSVLALVMALAVAIVPVPPVSAASAQTISRFTTSSPIVVLTFDTDTVRGYTPDMLSTLESRGVRASFGVTGTFASGNYDLIRRMVQDGDTLMNHSWDHPYFTQISSAERASQLQSTDSLIQQIAGVSLKPYFRPPYGDYNSSVLADLGANGYSYNIMWSVDPQGWDGKPASQISSIILNEVNPGAIVLMHTFVAGDNQALGGVIDQLKARGYRFATVGDFLGTPPPPPPEYRYFPETGYTVGHGFLRYWENHGGLPVFGFPITNEFQENGYTVQYFERARFEYHPENQPPYDVLLGLLGTRVAEAQGLLGTAPFQRISGASNNVCTYYPETGHTLCFGFRDFWNSHGGLAIYGYPISQEFQQGGYTVQYFERQRLEWHPENQPPWDVEGGLLGNQVYYAMR